MECVKGGRGRERGIKGYIKGGGENLPLKSLANDSTIISLKNVA